MESIAVCGVEVVPDLFASLPRVGVAGATDGYLRSPRGEITFGFGSSAFSVRIIARSAANAIVEANHYSGRFYRGSTLHLGVFFNEVLAGVLQFGFAMNPALSGKSTAIGSTTVWSRIPGQD